MNTNPSPRHLTLVLLEAYGFLAKLLQVSRTGANQILITNMDTVMSFLRLLQIPGTELIPAKTQMRAEELKIASRPAMQLSKIQI